LAPTWEFICKHAAQIEVTAEPQVAIDTVR